GRHCAGLPLALASITARATVHPEFPLGTLADELRDASMRLAAFDGGELTANLSATFTCSQDALPGRAVEAFGLLSLAPGADIGLAGAANLIGVPPGPTRNLLRLLETANLVQQYAPGRYRMHDLVRLHAAELAHRDDAADDALRRLVDCYLHTAATADRILNPHRAVIDLDPWRIGLAATEALADPNATALAHRFAGRAYNRIGQYADGIAHLQQALGLLRQARDLFGQAHTHRSLAWARLQQGYEQRALG